MPKGSAELTSARENEIIDACKRLYETMSFKEITIKEIGNSTSFTRTSIYNYFQTKEEIFLALLRREYVLWNAELSAALEENASMRRAKFAKLLAGTLSRRRLMLKLLSMNMYDIEENSRTERLVEFKREFGRSLELVGQCLRRCVPAITEPEVERFIYSFFPFVYGIYPYTTVTDKQRAAMDAAGLDFHQYSIYDIALSAATRLLAVDEEEH